MCRNQLGQTHHGGEKSPQTVIRKHPCSGPSRQRARRPAERVYGRQDGTHRKRRFRLEPGGEKGKCSRTGKSASLGRDARNNQRPQAICLHDQRRHRALLQRETDHPITTVRSDHRLAEAPLRGAVGRPRVQAAIGRRQAKVIGEPQNPRQRCNTNRGMR
jgi:hypothetical protein